MKPPARPDVALLASGGVDSAVALHLLREAGRTPVAVTLRLACYSGRDGDGRPAYSSPARAVESAAELAERLGVPHAVLDIGEDFVRRVIDPFAKAYRSGLTPSPCVYCNPEVKFGFARRFVRSEFGIDVLASGHYAVVEERAGAARLFRHRGLDRDQSYFLYRLAPDDLRRTLFPLAAVGGKDEVRSLARRLGFAAAEADDSMDVCFLPGGEYRELTSPIPSPGPILDTAGREVGRHDGCANFTVGQRKGLKKGFGKPMYVVEVIPADNAVVIGAREDVMAGRAAAGNVVAHAADELAPGARVFAKIRSGGAARPAVVVRAAGGVLAVDFDDPVFGPAPGQHLVLYDADGMVLGGGEIMKGETSCQACQAF
ncbi:MAG: tRNA 2-thiouridine(34) synthase MnmA [Planctomycetota bacterium]|jgi:tRNA-specific 2-thiouridylase|nr:tRNA 2-thiouridine(34) synthase MnmA [Planctomycetota bacterium]